MKDRAVRAKRRMMAGVCAVGVLGLLSGCQVSAPVVEVWGADEERELQVFVDTCNREPEVVAVESDEEIRLQVRVARSFALASNDCADGRTVILEEPLGDRRVIDDSSGAELEVQE